MKASFVHENKQKVTKECACSRNTLYLGVYICIVVSMIHIQLEHRYYINISIDFIKEKNIQQLLYFMGSKYQFAKKRGMPNWGLW